MSTSGHVLGDSELDMVHKWMTAYFWIWFTVISPGVRLDFVNYYLVLCRSPSTGPIGLNNLLSCANVNCEIHFSSVPDSQICHGCLSHLVWTAGSWMQRPQYLRKPPGACVYQAVQVCGESSAAASSHHLFTCPLCVLLSLLFFPNCQFAQ